MIRIRPGKSPPSFSRNAMRGNDEMTQIMTPPVITREKSLDMYRSMLLIRKFEEKLSFLFATRPMPGTMHQYNGEEAVAVGTCANLSNHDYITSTHRGHGHCLAKGADVRKVMAEMFAKSTGCCKGMGGSMHIADFSVGMLGANGIVGGSLPHAVGAAWACQYLENNQVAVAFFGDGASNEGSFHEAVNLAAVWKLPVVFVCENNLYGFSTHYRRSTPVADIAVRSVAYGIEGLIADGMAVEDVYEKVGQAVCKARSGGGPTIVECKTYRYMGHSRFEKPTYRTQAELDEWLMRDPILNYAGLITARYHLDASWVGQMDALVAQSIEEAVSFAESSPSPQASDYEQYIFAPHPIGPDIQTKEEHHARN